MKYTKFTSVPRELVPKFCNDEDNLKNKIVKLYKRLLLSAVTEFKLSSFHRLKVKQSMFGLAFLTSPLTDSKSEVKDVSTFDVAFERRQK